jgi:uncharacterized small protein (TIGR04563 family)
MGATDKQKQSLYFPEDTLREIMAEANRLDRSLSWTVQHAWRIARDAIRTFPGAMGASEAPPGSRAAPPPRPRERPHATDPRGEGGRAASTQVSEFLRGKFDHDLTS